MIAFFIELMLTLFFENNQNTKKKSKNQNREQNGQVRKSTEQEKWRTKNIYNKDILRIYLEQGIKIKMFQSKEV